MFSCEGIFQSHHTTVCIRILCLREKLAFINYKNGLPEKRKVGTRAGHFHLSLSSFLRKCCLQWAWVVTPNGLFLTTFFKEGWMSEPIAWWQKTLIIHSAHILLWLHTTHCENWELYIGSGKQAKKSRDSFKEKLQYYCLYVYVHRMCSALHNSPGSSLYSGYLPICT